MDKNYFNGTNILVWRKKMLELGGRPVDLDWLLDIGGGLNWSLVQMIRLYPSRKYKLDLSLNRLEAMWRLHLAENFPLQHLLGRCPWRDFEIETSSDALIPRQETELLIDFALKRVDSNQHGQWADLGTGSGPLTIALARELILWEGHAVEISPKALELAKRNLNKLAPFSKVKFYLGDWWEPLKNFWGDLNLVLSNPPYIPNNVLDTLHPVVKNHEPLIALRGGENGIDCLRKIILGASQGLASGGWLMLEHHHDQSEIILKLMHEAGLIELDFEKDLEGKKRFAIGRRY